MDRRVDQCVNVWHLVNNWKWPCSHFWRKCSVCHVSVFHPYSSNGLLITLNYPSSPIRHDMEPAIVGIGRGSRQSWVGYYSIMSSDFMSSSSLGDALSIPLGLLNGEDVHGFLSDWEWDTHTALSQKKASQQWSHKTWPSNTLCPFMLYDTLYSLSLEWV